MRKLLIGLVVLLMAGTAYGINWDGGAATTSWHDALNWDTDVLPATGDQVNIGGSATVDITGVALCGSVRVTALTATLNIANGASLTTDNGAFAFQDVNGNINWLGTVNGSGGISQFYTGQTNISGTATGSLDDWSLCGAGTVTVTGSNVTVSGSRWGVDHFATAKWVFDATGISTITLDHATDAIQLDADLGWGYWGGPGTREGGDLVIDLGAYTGFGDTFTLLDGPTGCLAVGEVFNNETILNLPSGWTATVNYGDGAGGSGDVTVTIVPEPATLALLGLGGLGLLARSRKRR